MNSSDSLTHLLLTRFNLHYSFYEIGSYICDEEWHIERFELFNRFCLPSVAQQTCRNFEWIIFFNEDERGNYPDFIRQTRAALPNIRFLFIKPEEDHRVNLADYIKEHVSSDYLITTRIDNDDAIAVNFIESIQNTFKKRYDAVNTDHFIINAGTGYQFETKFPYRKTLIKNYEFSPFLSLSSTKDSSENFKVILEHSHLDWREFSVSEDLKDQPFWAQIVHTKNRANRVLSLNLLPKISDENFPLFQDHLKNRYWFGIVMLPVQFLVTSVQRVAEKIKKVWN